MAHFLKNLVSNFSINILENGLNLKKSATHIFYVILFFTIQRKLLQFSAMENLV